MLVPETAMDEDRFAEPRQDEIGRSRQVPSVEAVAVTEGMDQPADHVFGDVRMDGLAAGIFRYHDGPLPAGERP